MSRVSGRQLQKPYGVPLLLPQASEPRVEEERRPGAPLMRRGVRQVARRPVPAHLRGALPRGTVSPLHSHRASYLPLRSRETENEVSFGDI